MSSQGRQFRDGTTPSEIFVVSNGQRHRLYHSLSTAKAERTRQNNQRRGDEQWHILRCATTEWDILPDR